MGETVTLLGDLLSAEVVFGGQSVVCLALQGEVRRVVGAPASERFDVVEL